jgi:protein TonB
MFADYLNENPWDNRSHRGWTTLASFGLQAVALSILLALPLLYTSRLPPLQAVGALVLPVPAPAPLQVARPRTSAVPTSNLAPDGRIVAPPTIPNTIARIAEDDVPEVTPLGLGVHGSTGPGDPRGVWRSIGNSVPVAPPVVPAPPHPIRVSRMMEGNLIRRVQPAYPPLARMARVQGAVVLSAVISKTGLIENLQLISGPALLVPAAIDAVKQWRYRPYVLNDDPVEVETQITVNFTLLGGN